MKVEIIVKRRLFLIVSLFLAMVILVSSVPLQPLQGHDWLEFGRYTRAGFSCAYTPDGLICGSALTSW